MSVHAGYRRTKDDYQDPIEDEFYRYKVEHLLALDPTLVEMTRDELELFLDSFLKYRKDIKTFEKVKVEIEKKRKKDKGFKLAYPDEIKGYKSEKNNIICFDKDIGTDIYLINNNNLYVITNKLKDIYYY